MILSAGSRTDIETIVADDPFSLHGVVEDLRITEWDPFIGVFAAESSGQVPGGAST